MAAQSELERAAVAFLRKRGFSVTDPEWTNTVETAGASLQLQRGASLLGPLMDWVGACAGPLRPELVRATVPLLLHVHFSLVEQGAGDRAHALLDQYVGMLPVQSDVVARLRAARTHADLLGLELYIQLKREERIVVPMTPLARDIILSKLLSADMLPLAEVFHRRVKIVGMQDAPATGLCPEAVEVDARVMNTEALAACAVDTGSPPMSYGTGGPSPGSPSGCHGVSVHSLDMCGLPMPRPDSQSRRGASTHFHEQYGKREELNSTSRLPSALVYRFDDDMEGLQEVGCTEISLDGRFCAAATTRGACLWDLQEKEKERCLLGPWVRMLDVSFTQAADLLVTGDQQGAVRLWGVPQRRALGTYTAGCEPVWAVRWCPVDHYFVSSGPRGEGLLWTVERAAPLRVFSSRSSGGLLARADLDVIEPHPSARYVALGSGEAAVMWDMAAARPVRTFLTGQGVSALAFAPDGATVAVGCESGDLQLWDVAAGRMRSEISAAHAGPITSLGFSWPGTESSGEMLLFSGGGDGAVRLWSPSEVPDDASEVCQPAASFGIGGSAGGSWAVSGGRFSLANLLLVAGTCSTW